MKKTAFLVMLLFSSITLFSQTQDIVFDQVTHKDGAGAFWIRNILQDHKGFIWIGSFPYLQRYDGYEFVTLLPDTSFANETFGGTLDLIEDNNGILWVNKRDGVFLFDPENERMICYIPELEIYDIHEDKDGIIWCAQGNYLLRMEPQQEDGFQMKELIFSEGVGSAYNIDIIETGAAENVSAGDQILLIYEDSLGRLWIGGNQGLYFFNKETHVFTRIDDDESGRSRMNHQNVLTIIEENPDVYWVRTNDEITRISNMQQAFSGSAIDKTRLIFTYYQDKRLMPVSNKTTTKQFYMDSQHNLWLGTSENGLLRMLIDKNDQPVFEELYTDKKDIEGTLFSCVMTITEDRTGLLWVGHAFKGSVKFRNEQNVFSSMEGMLGDYLSIYDINQVYEDNDGNLWVCCWGEGIFKISKKGTVTNYQLADPAFPDVTGNSTVSLLEIEDGIFWVGAVNGIWELNTHSGGCKKLFTQSIGGLIRSISRIENIILINMFGGGLWVYDLSNEELNHNTVSPDDTLGISSNTVYSVDIMEDGEVWVSTGINGLNRLRLNQTTGALEFLPLPEAIVNNKEFTESFFFTYQIYKDSKGTLWFCTDYDGLIKLNPESGEIQQWTTNEGLTSNSVRGIEEDKDGNLWVATLFGLSVLERATGRIRNFSENDGLPEVLHSLHAVSFKNKEGLMYFSGMGGFYRVDPDLFRKNEMIPPVVITNFSLFDKTVKVDSGKNAILTKNIAYTQKIDLKYYQHDISFTFAALDYNDPSKNKYNYMLEGYQDEWVETDASNRIATYTNLSPGEYTFRVKGSNNDGVWNEEGAYINITIHPPFWKTVWAYIVYGVFILLLLRGYIFWRTQRLRKENIVLEKQVSERTAELKTANTQLRQHEQELQEVNTLLEKQKEELMQQKEELESTLENLKKTQEQLVESEKMAAVGGLVAGVAHEMNTPVGIGITAISNLLDDVQKMAQMYVKDEINRENFKEFLESTNDTAKLIQKNLERAASLIQSFKQVSTDQVAEQQRIFALKDYLNDILLSLRPKFRGKKIDFKIECDEKLKLNSYPGIYAQIFTNLLLNSLQHGFYEKDKGTITIKANMDKELLKIQYSDDGTGISKKDLPHIFEPFYTSDQHRGTGLGLNIIYNLVKQKLHGTIASESEQGKGVLFKIEVPAK